MSRSLEPEKDLSAYQRFNQWMVSKFEAESAISATQRHFQPAAVELEATPPNPFARAISKAVILLFLIAVVWACIGRVDVVAVATGQVVPSERVKNVQPLTLGEVSAIYVREGQQVEQGEVLLRLDSTIAEADITEVAEELHSVQAQLLRANHLQAFIESGASTTEVSATLQNYEADYSDRFAVAEGENTQSGVWALQQEIHSYLNSRESLNQQMLARDAEARMLAATVRGLEQTLPIVQERLDAMDSLLSQNLVARTQYLELKQEHIEQQQNLESGRENHQQLLNETADLAAQIESLKSGRLAELANEQDQLTRQISGLNQELARAAEREQQLELRAPIAGSIQNLQVYTLGGVVQPAEVLMQIVPDDAELEVEAWVENKDIGFVEAGQIAEIKIDTFQFTKYGVIDGSITTLSEDAVNDEQRGPIYRAVVALEQDWMQIDNKQVRLSPGMSVAVEVKTDQRRLIEYFMSPLLRYSQESVRER